MIAVLVLAACSTESMQPGNSTTTPQTIATTTTVPPTTTPSSTFGRAIGGELVKLDMETLEPVPGLDPIPLSLDSWTIDSDDGKWVVVFDWGKLTPIKVHDWNATGTFERPPNTARVIDGDTLYMYSPVNGVVSSIDLNTGELSSVGEWRPNIQIRGDLQVTASGIIAGLGDVAADEDHWGGPWAGTDHWVHWLDPSSGESGEIEVGPIERYRENTGIFDGDYEVAEIDSPGIVWGEDQVYIVHADGPEITVVDLVTREMTTHEFDLSAWLDRVLAFWVPSASAGGAMTMGTESTAVLSADGRYLLISGSRHDVVRVEGGSLDEEIEGLNVIVIDIENWKVVDQPDLSVHSVQRVGDLVMGRETVSYSPWIQNLYVLSIDEGGRIAHTEPLLVEEGCESFLDPVWLVCRESMSTTTHLSLTDVRNLETTDGPEVGHEDYLLRNGVLADWAPFGD